MAHSLMDFVAHAKHALKSCSIADIRQLEVEPDGERVLLSGIVGSFYYKQLAQELVRSSDPAREVANAVRVEYRVHQGTPDWRRAGLVE